MLRVILILAITLVCVGVSSASDSAGEAPAAADRIEFLAQGVPARSHEFLTSLGLSKPSPAYAQQSCCKICTVGKACGNTCIARDKICHVGPGCACDG